MNKKIVIILICIILAIVAVCVLFANKNLKDNNNETNSTQNELIVNEIEEENIINENKVDENIIENETTVEPVKTEPNTGTSVAPSSAVYESDSDVGTTDKKQQAIDLVKEHWGEDSTVSFRCDSVTTDGEYIIAVVSLETASVKGYFKVNINTKSVEVDY